jgi:thiol-disulfide isomerase/thioredoxin
MSVRVSAVAVVVLAVAAQAADAPPRYHLQPGQELSFRATSDFKYGEGDNAGSHGSKADWTVWVLRANPDGSYRLVLREKSVFIMGRGKDKNERPPETSIVYADVFPDGRVSMNKTIQYRHHPDVLFPRLPSTAAEAASGWNAVNGDETTKFKPKAPGATAFESVKDSLFNKIYLSTHSAKSTFDPARGFVTKIEANYTQGYGFNGKGTGLMELVDVKTIDAEKLLEFAAVADKYFAALAACEEKTEAAQKAKPEEAKALTAKALETLKTAEKEITQPDFHADLAARIDKHDSTAKYVLDEAERRDKVLGKPAAEFETADINGKKVKLADLKGQVVVLDFWYRGCGWCVKAMPQMNQLADDFAGKPVAIFGMNTDQKEEDAKFVIDKMGLKYATLKAEGLPQKFGVQGFPTLIIIDQRGNVADMHVGYSPTLREEVGKTIRDLLAKQ